MTFIFKAATFLYSELLHALTICNKPFDSQQL